MTSTYLYIKILVLLFVFTALINCDNKNNLCTETPCITEKAKLGMTENNFIAEFGRPLSMTQDKDEIIKELADLKNRYENFTNSFENSSDERIEKSLDYLDKALKDTLQYSKFKKIVYNIKIRNNSNEYLKKGLFSQ